MSKETIEWLNQNTLIGFGNQAWHKSDKHQGDEPNHYPEGVPVADVERRLFDWEPVLIPSFGQRPNGTFIQEEAEAKVWRPDTDTILGHVGKDYQIHAYRQWLLENVSTVLDAELAVESAGLLRGGAIAWVTIALPQTLQFSDVTYRPRIVAATCLNGWFSTSYRRSVILPVCDNTLSASLKDDTDVVKFSHRSKSLGRLAEAREALKIVFDTGEEFAQEVASLQKQKVTDRKFERWAEAFSGVAGKKKEDIKGQPAKKIDQLITLWRDDERVAPWKGNAFGVWQAANTWMHHFQGVRGGDQGRFDRNQERVILGRELKKQDRRALDLLAAVK